MNIFFKILVIILSISYPFIIFYCLNNGYGLVGVLLLITIITIKIFIEGKVKLKINCSLLLAGLTLIVLFTVYNDFLYLKLYPVMVNLTFLYIFGSSLYNDKSIVEKIASIKHPNADQGFKTYCRQITIMWCCFFVFNGTVAAITALFCSHKIWAFYTGFLSYFLIALMFIVEYVRRQYAIKKMQD